MFKQEKISSGMTARKSQYKWYLWENQNKEKKTKILTPSYVQNVLKVSERHSPCSLEASVFVPFPSNIWFTLYKHHSRYHSTETNDCLYFISVWRYIFFA